jgi:2-phospho-L-lactate transferase/gluconeogenesis factor (CofD/UPF0052 family)
VVSPGDHHPPSLSVVVFSGGRGSSVLSRELIGRRDVRLTLAINGYDDGMSTGEVRRFLGDSLGPSDFRKNASLLARTLGNGDAALVDLLDVRLPDGVSRDAALDRLHQIDHPGVRERLDAFEGELRRTGKPFDFADCSVGNLVFAGSFLRAGRRFNDAVDDYCGLLGLPAGLVDNVSDGTDAYLVAVDLGDRLLASEADIVDAKRRNRIKDIYLIERRLRQEEAESIARLAPKEMSAHLASLEREIPINPRLLERIAAADIIVYSPGTQHSSLFPSYLTRGLSGAIAANLTAIKLLITNIQADAEIADTTAVEIIEKAVYYLQDKGKRSIPAPCLITHYVMNDPRASEDAVPYVPLGRLDSIEDPRLVRIGNYEDGITGRHDAARVLEPFFHSLLPKPDQRVAVWLHDSGSTNKVAQTLLEMVRAGVQRRPLAITTFYGDVPALDESFVTSLPFPVTRLASTRKVPADLAGSFDYILLFESSGMYNGEDVASLAGYLTSGRLDAVWGSRRLSVTDIEASVRLQYRHSRLMRAASLIGSHVLSAAYLMLYGRYISDTLSGLRAIRTTDLGGGDFDLDDRLANQRLLSHLLGRRAEIIETPVQFLPMSPGKVRRTTVTEGLRSLVMMLRWRLAGGSSPPPPPGR